MTPIPLSESTELPRKIAVVGAGGLLGWELARWFSGRVETVALDHGALDVTDESAVARLLDREKPLALCNAVGFTTVDAAETEREKARLLNATVPRILADACVGRGIRFVHFGTDQVFDGSRGTPMTEDDEPNPLNYYAATKLEGEHAALERNAIVMRVQWLYGERKNRFAALKDRARFPVIVDQFGAVTWTKDIAAAVDALLCRKERGLFHMSYDDWASWAEIFAFVRERLELSVELVPTTTASLNLPAKRPPFSVMANGKIRRALGVASMGLWRERLGEFLGHLPRGGATGS